MSAGDKHPLPGKHHMEVPLRLECDNSCASGKTCPAPAVTDEERAERSWENDEAAIGTDMRSYKAGYLAALKERGR